MHHGLTLCPETKRTFSQIGNPHQGFHQFHVPSASFYISHLVKSLFASSRAAKPFDLRYLPAMYIHICLPINILYIHLCIAYSSRLEARSSSLHHPPQRQVDLPLVSPSHPPEPGQDICVQVYRNSFLWNLRQRFSSRLPLPPCPQPWLHAACGTFPAPRPPKPADWRPSRLAELVSSVSFSVIYHT